MNELSESIRFDDRLSIMEPNFQKPTQRLNWVDLALRTIAFTMAVGGLLLLWIDAITTNGAVTLLGLAVIAVVLDRFK